MIPYDILDLIWSFCHPLTKIRLAKIFKLHVRYPHINNFVNEMKSLILSPHLVYGFLNAKKTIKVIKDTEKDKHTKVLYLSIRSIDDFAKYVEVRFQHIFTYIHLQPKSYEPHLFCYMIQVNFTSKKNRNIFIKIFNKYRKNVYTKEKLFIRVCCKSKDLNNIIKAVRFVHMLSNI